jgi:hypothetical protein
MLCFKFIPFQLLNRTALTGSARPFQEVPFPDGTRPTADVSQSIVLLLTADCIIQHNYPIINSIQALENLTDAQLKGYHQGYCPLRVGVNGGLARPVRIREVLTAIGCDEI